MNKNFRIALVMALFAFASLLYIVPASAQSVYGSIFGTVSDKTGAVISDATVTVTDEAKGTVVNVISNGSGDYSVPHLIPDIYDIKVVAKGFRPFETKGISVQADTAPRIDPTMDVGSDTGTTVEVNADAQPELKTDRADVATVFDQQQVSSLPIGDQNFTNLQLLLPGAQLLGWSHAATENPQGSKQIQIDGQAFGGTAFELDGTDNQDPILGIIVINPALDAVTETKITTQNFDAELGKAVSAVVTAQTRSGTNKFHGSAYDFRTSNANLAKDPYNSAPIPAGIKSRWGGSIGGPVLRDRAFFFGNWESQRSKVGTSNTITVPTAHLVASCLGTAAPYAGAVAGCDFSEYANLLASGQPNNQLIYDNSGATSVAFANNVIPAAQVSPQALALLKLLAPYAPNQGATPDQPNFIANNYSASGTGLFNTDAWTARGDYTVNQRAHAFARFSRFTDTLSGKAVFGAAGGVGFGSGGLAGSSKGTNESLATGMDIAVNPNLLTDWRVGYYRYHIITAKYDQGQSFASQLGIPGINTGSYFTSGAPGFVIPSGQGTANIGAGLNIGRCNCPLTEDENQLQFVNNWTKIAGNHSVKLGIDLRFAHNLRVPSDTDRSGQFNFANGQTGDNGGENNGLAWASFLLGDVNNFGRYVSVSTNAREAQKRLYFYGQDTWRATHNLTLNLGLRWEIYTPEAVNGNGNGSLLNLADGYMHVAGIGVVPRDMGWKAEKSKGFAPRIGVTYQLDPKTVIRAGYGRSFDLGVFGSIFGHVVTQNLPVLANQSVSTGIANQPVFTLAQGPPAFALPSVPSNGLLPAQGYAVQPKARPNPLHFPTIDAWNLSVQRSLTPTLNLTLAYVANKGTHTLGDTDQNNTNPNEAALFLPAQYSVTGQPLHWDPNGPNGKTTPLPAGYSGGVSNSDFLRRYYGGSLPACRDSSYATPLGEPGIQPGMCGWNQGISYYGDDQNTEFDALQVTLAKQFDRGLAITNNYQWASAYGDQNGYWTWDHHVTRLRDSNVRRQQLTTYGSYDLPFGKGKMLMANSNRLTDLLIGGYQLSGTVNFSSGLPWSVGYDDFNVANEAIDPNAPQQTCNANVGGTAAPCRPNASGHMKTSLSKFNASTHSRSFFTAQPRTGGIFSFPGLDVVGNAGANTYFGPIFFNTDLAFTKSFTVWESVALKLRMDAFNAFNHINAGQPNNDVLGSSNAKVGDAAGTIGGQAPAGQSRQLEFSARIQF